MWLATALLLANTDRLWGQDAIEIPTLVFSIDENSEAGTEVGALAELYPELNHFRFSNRSRSTLFHVHPDTGVISIRDGAKLDFEKRSTITLTIVADIREEQNDPYLAEFAESLRDEGFSSRTLSRLIPLVQRIQVQVLVRDVQDAEEVPVSGNVSALEVPAVVDGSPVNPSIDASMTESSSTASVRQEPVTLDIQKPATDLSSTDLSVPGPPIVTPESKVSVGNRPTREEEGSGVPDVSMAAEEIITAAESEVPMPADVPTPSDVPPVLPEPSDANRKTLALSGSSGQSALQLNAATADGSGKIAPKSPKSGADQATTNAEGEAAEVVAQLQKTFLLRSLVSLIIALGAAYVLRHRWKTFRKSLPQPHDENVTEQKAEVEQEVAAIETSPEDQAELKAADEFVTEPILDEVFPQIEQTPKSVIAYSDEEETGVSFDPESLIDDDYFNDADDLQSLKAKNAELGDRLEKLAGSVESAPQDRLPTDDRETGTETSFGRSTVARTEERSLAAVEFSRDQPGEFADGSRRADSSEFARSRAPHSTYHEETSSPTEPRWNSDWPGYAEEKPDIPGPAPQTEKIVAVAADSKSVEDPEETDDKIASLRNELADLFAIQKKAQAAEAKGSVAVESVAQEAADTREGTSKPEACPEETHLESVAQYLSQLLERSKKDEAADAIFVDRRKTGEKSPGKWDGADRRGGQKAKAPVKSYIESYLSEHGGELSHDSVTQTSSEASFEESTRPQDLKPPVERRPVDVQAIREHMNSFRNVASTSLEHALASHRIRQAKGKVAGRTTLVAGLSVVSVLAIATNSAMKIYFPSLGWLMGLIVCLAIAELILRVEAIRRHRRELRYRILDPAKKAGERNDKVDVDGVASAEEAGVTLS